MSDEPLDRDAYALELLKFLANGGEFDGDQMGPDHTLDQISVAADLIREGYMDGSAFPNARKPVNIGGPGITPKGRRRLADEAKAEKMVDRTIESSRSETRNEGSMRAFVSYSVAEKDFGGATKQALETLGVECFLAHEDIRVSEEWKARIVQELQEANIFVALLSAKFKASEWCSQEVGFIVSRPNVVIIPLSIDGTIAYGFISHIQAQHFRSESEISTIVEHALYLKKPRQMIPIQIGRVRGAGSFRSAEASVRPLVPFFRSFTDTEVADFADAAVNNYEVWDAGLCRSDYLPKFVAANAKRIPAALRNELKEKVDNLVFPDSDG